jgi:DNA primase
VRCNLRNSEIERIRSEVNLLNIVERDVTLKKVATTRGGEYAGKCPFCGGEDRFRIQPAQGLWWCRQCSPDDRWQDVFAYAQKRDRVSFYEAFISLSSGRLPPMPTSTRSNFRKVEPQPLAWSEIAERIVRQCVDVLWSGTPASRGALAWLHRRGLEGHTLKEWRIGFNPTSQRINGLWLDKGITIPYYAAEQIWAVNVRRSDGFLQQYPDEGKYRMVKGSKRVLFGANRMVGRQDVVVTEGEFDALLAWQCAADSLDVVTMGGAQSMPSGQWLAYLAWGKRFYVATDNDAAGDKAANNWLELVKSRGSRATVPDGKDLTEYWQRGGDVSQWLTSLLPS